MSEDVLRYWGLIDGGGDPLTTQWPGVSSVLFPASVIVLYLTMVATAGKDIKPTNFKNRPFVVSYNLLQVNARITNSFHLNYCSSFNGGRFHMESI